ncbi:MAG: hypothetical protein WCH61_10425, partial [bacterium]
DKPGHFRPSFSPRRRAAAVAQDAHFPLSKRETGNRACPGVTGRRDTKRIPSSAGGPFPASASRNCK